MKENPCSTREINVLYVESAADQTDHFDDAFDCETVAHGYDVVTTL